MRFHHLRNRLIPFVLGFILLPGVGFADQLLMKNGDIITGEIIKIADDKVYIDPSYADEYAVDLAEVNSIEAENLFEVVTVDGRKIDAHLAGESDGEQALIVEEQPMNIGILELQAATDPTKIPPVDRWDGQGELGFVNTTGNTETVALNARLNFVRTGKNWRHRFTGTAMMTSEDGIEDNERYTMEVQSDRKLTDKSWLFGAFRWDADKFGSYDPQASLTAGYGYQLMKSDRHEMKGEIGAGYKSLTETVSGDESSEIIARFLLDDWWQVFSNTRWTNRLLIESGSSNTFTQFNTGLAVSMTDAFAVKLGFEARNNTNIPPGDTEHTDTITSANLVYDF
jgi:putative salt-induced outer membrane protein